MDGRKERCAKQQTDYAATVAHLGLSRGIEEARPSMSESGDTIGRLPNPSHRLRSTARPRLMDPEGWAAEQAQSIARQAAPAFARARTAESDRTAKKAAEAQAEKDRRRRERAEAELEAQKALSARLRALPLPDVLDALGSRADPREKGRWRAGASTSR